MVTRGKRDVIWPVFEEYRAQLASRKLKEVDDAYRDAALLTFLVTLSGVTLDGTALATGDEIVVAVDRQPDGTTAFSVIDRWRLPLIGGLVLQILLHLWRVVVNR